MNRHGQVYQKRFEQRLVDLISRTGMKDKLGIEREVFLCLLAADPLYDKADLLYDFEHNLIRIEGLSDPRLSSDGEVALATLAFDLYGGNGGASPSEIFPYLDRENAILALAAIRIRYNIEYGIGR